MTYNDGPQIDPDHPGQWKMPTILPDRTQTTVDPQTGALLHAVSLDAESLQQNNYHGMFLFFGGFERMCDPRMVGPAGGPQGFLCSFPRYGQMANTVYWIVPSTAEVRMLGSLPILLGGPMGALNADLVSYGNDGKGNIVRVSYTGNFQPADIAPVSGFSTYSSVPFGDMVHAFDPSFDTSAYKCGTVWAGAGQYALFTCPSNGQDSPGWLAVLYGGDGRPIQPGCNAGDACPRIVAAMNVFTAPATLNCTLHNIQQLGNSASINVQTLAGQPKCVAFGHMVYWRFLEDPHGTDTTNTKVVVDQYFSGGGHWDYGPMGRLDAQDSGWGVVFGADYEQHLNQPISLQIDDSPYFAGTRGVSYGNTASKHPSYHQVSGVAPASELNWFMDAMSFDGSNFYGQPPGATLLSGQLYKFNFAPGAGPLARKQLPTLAVSGGYSLIDISGPGSILSDGPEAAYRYCVTLAPGECRAGSLPGDVYINAPDVQFLQCASSDGPNPQNRDICVGNIGAFTQAITQIVMGADSADSIKRSRVITHGLSGIRNSFYYWTAKSLPDASWALFTRGLVQPPFGNLLNVWMAKLPPQPQPDGVDRSTFLPLTVSLTPPANPNIARAVIQFGYAEQGSPDQYYCTSRRDPCVAASEAFTVSNPFQYASEGYQGVPCTTSCQIQIPVLPVHVVYYKAVYLDASGNVVAMGPQGVSAELAAVSVNGGIVTSPSAPPPAPVNLTGTATGSTVTLSWTSGGGTTVGFNVYRNGALVGKAPQATYVDQGLTPATAYTYTVAAYNAAGAESPKTSPLTINTSGPVSITITPASATLTQGATQAFTATVTGATNTSVTWSLSSPIGTISADGLYQAPDRITSVKRVNVIATSVADPSITAAVALTIQPPATGAFRLGLPAGVQAALRRALKE